MLTSSVFPKRPYRADIIALGFSSFVPPLWCVCWWGGGWGVLEQGRDWAGGLCDKGGRAETTCCSSVQTCCESTENTADTWGRDERMATKEGRKQKRGSHPVHGQMPTGRPPGVGLEIQDSPTSGRGGDGTEWVWAREALAVVLRPLTCKESALLGVRTSRLGAGWRKGEETGGDTMS